MHNSTRETEVEVGPSTKGEEESTVRKWPIIDDIPGYVPPWNLGASMVRINKNKKYSIKMSTTLKGYI